jgi:predicted HAD superfamily phosphohydrolase YqeG
MISTILEWLFWALVSAVFILYCARRFNASQNSRNLRPPQHTATGILALTPSDWEGHWKDGVRAIVFDVDLTITGMRQDEISNEVRDRIWMLQEMGFKIILASKSSTPRPNIYKRLHGDRQWLQVWRGAVKEDPAFLRRIKGMIGDAHWTLGPNYKILIIGDKLTDMGYSNPSENARVVTLLVNPQFGKDLPGEVLVMRRHFERITLRRMGVERAA